MEKLLMCRICLVENVSMYAVVNKNLHEFYEKLTDIPFKTEDRRPMLACFICCTKLKQCCRFQRKCLEAEELFAQMMKADYKPDTITNGDPLSCYNGFEKTCTENINIVDAGHIESVAVKEEFPADCERLDDVIEPQWRHHVEEVELENANSCPAVQVLPAQQSSYEESVMQIKINVEDEQESEGPPSAKEPILNRRRGNLEDTITNTQKKNENNRKLLLVSTNIQNSQNFNNRLLNTASSCRKIITKDNIRLKISNRYIDNDNINNHQSQRVKETRYKCDTCERCFNKKCHLTKHARIHTGEKPFQCNICQRSFNDKSNLNDHTRIHTGENRFKCDICQRTFSKKSYLTCHVRVHTGEEPFKCDICQRTFIQQCHLKRHTRTHTGEKPKKPFMCDVCKRSFSSKYDLRTHIRTHTGETPFKCGICQRGFKQKIHLTYHISTHTKRTEDGPKHCILGS